MNNSDKIAFVRSYFARLTASDMDGIISMFEPDAKVSSPYVDGMSADDFFAQLGVASARNQLKVFDVLVGERGDSVAAHFEYDWTLGSGDNVIFRGVDYFKFGPSGKFASLVVYYDSYPIRHDVGDKYV